MGEEDGGTGRARPFATEWGPAPNPMYDVWTSVNGSEVVPGLISPLVASTFNRYDHAGRRELMDVYPGGARVELFEPRSATSSGSSPAVWR